MQTVQINGRNQAAAGEAITAPDEIRELRVIVRDAMARETPNFRAMRLSGLQPLFDHQGLDMTATSSCGHWQFAQCGSRLGSSCSRSCS